MVNQKKLVADPSVILIVSLLILFVGLFFSTTLRESLTGLAVTPVSVVRPPGSCTGSWTTCQNAYLDDSNSATATLSKTKKTITGDWYNNGFAIPATATINKVEIRADHSFSGITSGYIDIVESINGGSSYSPLGIHRATGTVLNTERTTIFDVTSDFAWTPSILNTASTRVRAICARTGTSSSYPTCKIELLTITVTYTEACTPEACLPNQCGSGIPEPICGGTKPNCGSCPSGQTCSANLCVCQPKTCAADYAGQCSSSLSNGCGGFLDCSANCLAGQTCNTGTGLCQAACTPTTCASLGATCGSPSDGCGGTLSCGTCSAGNTCSASNLCTPFCSDGLDNDGDTKIDYPADPGCMSASDTDETDAPASPAEMKGVALPCWYTNCYEDTSVSQTLDTIKNNGANWVEIIPTQYMTTATDNVIGRTSQTASDIGVGNVIKLVHQKGLKVFLKPHVDVGGIWRGEICPSNPDAFWTSYQQFIQTYINICNDPDPDIYCDMFALGTELSRVSIDRSTSDPKYCNPGSQSWTNRWIGLAQSTKSALPSAKETYCGNHDDYQLVGFWTEPSMDYVGIDMYSRADVIGPDASNNCAPTIDQMKTNIRTKVSEQVNYATPKNKDIVDCEQGFPDTDCGSYQPWTSMPGQEVDYQEQADAYQAFRSVLNEPASDKIVGSFVWEVDPRGQNTPTSADPNGFILFLQGITKTAWNVLGNYWKNTCGDTICQASESCSTCTADCGSCSPPPLPPPSSTTILDQRIATGGDDAEEGSTGTLSLTSTDLELMNDVGTSQGVQKAVGLRYQLNIPRGATIQKAYIQFTVDETSSDSIQLTFKAESSDNSAQFTSTTNGLSSRATTAASASWTPLAWNTIDEAGANEQTPELKNIIQEVVNRPLWQANNYLSIIITGTGTGKRVARAFEATGSSAKTGVLHIEATPECTVDAHCATGKVCTNNVCTTLATLKATPPNFKVAFIADSGRKSNFQSVLNLIKTEEADMVIEMGDLGYGNASQPTAPSEWEVKISSVLDQTYTTCPNDASKHLFPYFFSAGNHEIEVLSQWTQTQANGYKGYREMLRERWNCQGITQDNDGNPNNDGTKSSFTYNNLFVVLTAPDETCATDCDGDNAQKASYLDSKLASSDSLWKIAAWHRVRNQLQTGSYVGDPTMDQLYQNALNRGAIIATAHWHTYSRTHAINNIVNPTPVDTTNPLEIKPGQTIVFHSGLGGDSIRDQLRCWPNTPPYGCNGEWASIYSNNQSATYGALFIEFNVDTNGDSITEPRMAHSYFKNINGQVIDDFTLNNTAPGNVI